MKWYESPILANIIAIVTFIAGIIVTIYFNKRMLAIERARDQESETTRKSAAISFEIDREGTKRIIRIKNDGTHAAVIKGVLLDGKPFQQHDFVISKTAEVSRIETNSYFDIHIRLFQGASLKEISVIYTDGTNQEKHSTQSLNLSV